MKFAFSAGGIVFKRGPNGGMDILLAQHSGHHGWVFPKGTIEMRGGKRETKEAAALREVKEETGILGKIVQPLEAVTYWFVQDGEKIKKTVYYFLMEYEGGSIDDHDWEMECVEWLSMEEVGERLTYTSDKKIWQEARKRLKSELISVQKKV